MVKLLCRIIGWGNLNCRNCIVFVFVIPVSPCRPILCSIVSPPRGISLYPAAINVQTPRTRRLFSNLLKLTFRTESQCSYIHWKTFDLLFTLEHKYHHIKPKVHSEKNGFQIFLSSISNTLQAGLLGVTSLLLSLIFLFQLAPTSFRNQQHPLWTYEPIKEFKCKIC